MVPITAAHTNMSMLNKLLSDLKGRLMHCYVPADTLYCVASTNNLGLLLGTEAPAMLPAGIDFSFFVFFSFAAISLLHCVSQPA